MVVGVLETQGSRASATIIFTTMKQNQFPHINSLDMFAFVYISLHF